jgi:hypothetical protein
LTFFSRIRKYSADDTSGLSEVDGDAHDNKKPGHHQSSRAVHHPKKKKT